MLNMLTIVFDQNLKLTLKSEYIEENILLFLKKFRFIKFWRINLCYELAEANSDCQFIDLDEGNPTIKRKVKLDEERFEENVVHLVQESLKELSIKMNWEYHRIEKAFEKFKVNNYRTEYQLFKKLKHPKLNYGASFFVIVNETHLDLNLRVFESRKIIREISFYKMRLNFPLMKMFFTKITWHDRTVIITDSIDEIYFSINIDTGKLSIVFKPRINKEEDLKRYLSGFDPTLSFEESNKLLYGFK